MKQSFDLQGEPMFHELRQSGFYGAEPRRADIVQSARNSQGSAGGAASRAPNLPMVDSVAIPTAPYQHGSGDLRSRRRHGPDARVYRVAVGKDVDMSYRPSAEDHIHSLLDEAVTFLLQAQASACNAADEAYEGQTEMENLTRELRNVIHSAISVRDKWSPLYREKIACLRDEAADMEREMREHGDYYD